MKNMTSNSTAITVPFCRPSIFENDIRAVEAVMRKGWIAYGPEVNLFERAVAEFVGSGHAVSLNSCTTALEAALRLSGITGEVILPSFTWVAVANAVINAGATPVFADIDNATYNLSPETIGECLSPRTEAIIVPHYGGQPAEIDSIFSLCKKHGLLLIEDCAETMGGKWKGKQAGSTGIGCFSFYPTKAITTAMGGMLVSHDQQFIEDVRTYATHGLRTSTPLDGSTHKPWERAAVMPGHNLRMPNLLAAIGLEQMKRINNLNLRRQIIAKQYDEALQELAPILTTPQVSTFAEHVYQMYSVRIAEGKRDFVLRELWDAKISANTHFNPPIHVQPWYSFKEFDKFDLPVTNRLKDEILTLPIFPDMKEKEVEYVVSSLYKAVMKL